MPLSEDAAAILADQVGYLVNNYLVKNEIAEDKLPQKIKDGFNTANRLIQDGKNEEAVSLILRMVKEEPNYVRGRLRLIQAYNTAGNPIMALSNSQYALAQATTARTKAQLLGLSGQAVYAMYKKYQDPMLLTSCEAFYTNAIRVYPSDPFARWNIVGIIKDSYGIESGKITSQLSGLCDQCLEDGFRYRGLYDRLLNDWGSVLGDKYSEQKENLTNAMLSSAAISEDHSDASKLSRRALVAASLAAGAALLYQGVSEPDIAQRAMDFFNIFDASNIQVEPTPELPSDVTHEVELQYDLEDLQFAEIKYDLGDLT